MLFIRGYTSDTAQVQKLPADGLKVIQKPLVPKVPLKKYVRAWTGNSPEAGAKP